MGCRFWMAGLIGATAMAAHGSVAGVAPSTARYAITTEEAAHAVLAAHPEFAGDAIELAASVEARQSDPQLTAGPLERWNAMAGVAGGRAPARLRLHCSSDQVCLPFYVMVHLSGKEPEGERMLRSTSTGAEARLQHGPVRDLAVLAVKEARVAEAAPAISMRSGTRAVLLIDSGRLHLRVPVMCLQGGSTGSTIRVRALQHGAVYRATILDQATLRGTL